MNVIAPALPCASVGVAQVGSLSMTALCGAESLFVQPIVSPAFAAMGSGANLKPAIVALTVAAAVAARQAVPDELPPGAALGLLTPFVHAARASDAALTRTNRMARCIDDLLQHPQTAARPRRHHSEHGIVGRSGRA